MKFVLYNHVGSANHGCEALVRSISHMLGEKNTILLSDRIEEEYEYGIDKLIEVKSSLSNKKNNILEFVQSYIQLKFKNNYFYMDILPYKKAIKDLSLDDVLVSIGGDIFCYDNYPKYNLLHQYALSKVKHSILLGCSIEPDLLKDSNLLQDLKSFELITARETITLQALHDAGVENTIYCPDSAFNLSLQETVLPDNFIPNNTVGINISPLVLNMADDSELIMENIRIVIKYILDNTSSAIAFVPHVTWENNDDRVPLKKLYDEFKNTNRVCLIDDQNAQRLKWIISQCSYFIGARTHATIAAYSTGVPTLVLGYSVKSKGIARDLFGTEENYVIPYEKINSDNCLLMKFKWILNNSKEIRKILINKTKEYQKIIRIVSSQILDCYKNC